MTQMIIDAAMIAAACSFDCFVYGFSYGANKIKLPPLSIIVINLICALMLGAALCAGALAGALISRELATTLCCAVLFLLGIAKIFDSFIKNLIKRRRGIHKQMKFSMLSLNFIISIFAEPEQADADKSQTLSAAEAAALAVVLSLDGIAAGMGAGLVSGGLLGICVTVAFSAVANLCLLLGGRLLGGALFCRSKRLELSWLSGLLLLTLAVLNLCRL